MPAYHQEYAMNEVKLAISKNLSISYFKGLMKKYKNISSQHKLLVIQ